jgi:putative membrane protein
MTTLLLNLIISSLAVFVAAAVLPGVHIDGYVTVVLVAIVFGVINAVVKPILTIATLPITIVTLGIFLLVINILLVYLTAWLVPGFSVEGWLSALLFSLIVSVVGGVLQSIAK